MKYKMNAGMASHRGKKQTNEDASLVLKKDDGCGTIMTLAAVMDGLGGYEAGDVASQYVENELRNWFLNSLSTFDLHQISADVTELFTQLNEQLLFHCKQNGVKLGTTCSLLIMYNGQYIIKHIGDCRIYKMIPQPSIFSFLRTPFQLLTKDHTYVQMLVDDGRLTIQEARIHPNRNVLLHCLGLNENVYIDTVVGKYNSMDVFILCSDGLYDLMKTSEFEQGLRKFFKQDCEYHDVAQTYMEQIILSPNIHDNLSIIVMRNSVSLWRKYLLRFKQ